MSIIKLQKIVQVLKNYETKRRKFGEERLLLIKLLLTRRIWKRRLRDQATKQNFTNRLKRKKQIWAHK
jgi:hypothetical protein